MPLRFQVFTLKIVVLNQKYIAKITNPITKPHFLTIIKLTYTGIKKQKAKIGLHTRFSSVQHLNKL